MLGLADAGGDESNGFIRIVSAVLVELGGPKLVGGLRADRGASGEVRPYCQGVTSSPEGTAVFGLKVLRKRLMRDVSLEVD